MARIAVATFQHETNTFAPSKAGFADFESGGGWPGYRVGGELLEAIAGTNIPIAGFVDTIKRSGHQPVPLVFANATPSAHVTTDAFERIVGDIRRQLEKVGAIDALYLDLHGAMVTEAHDDGEGEILARLRQAVGPHVPIVASLDLHANLSERMLDGADGMVAYRTYPHVDMAYTGTRTAELLKEILRRQERPAKVMQRLDFLIPLTAQCTLIQPADGIYGDVGKAEVAANGWFSFAPAFPAADVACCAPALFGMSFDRAQLDAEIGRLAAEVAEQEGDFHTEFLSADAAVVEAIRLSKTTRSPIVLADTQDNPGAGGNGDTTGLLAALITHRAPRAVIGLLTDPAAAKRAHQAGLGAELDFSLGAKSGMQGHFPVVGRFKVDRLGDGNFTCTGPFYKGAQMSLGPMAALRKDDVTVVITSRKVQAADQEMFRHLLIDPSEMKIIALKSSVHFRAHFGPIAEKVMIVAAPGPMAANPEMLPWRKLRPGIRLRPLGRPFVPPAG